LEIKSGLGNFERSKASILTYFNYGYLSSLRLFPCSENRHFSVFFFNEFPGDILSWFLRTNFETKERLGGIASLLSLYPRRRGSAALQAYFSPFKGGLRGDSYHFPPSRHRKIGTNFTPATARVCSRP